MEGFEQVENIKRGCIVSIYELVAVEDLFAVTTNSGDYDEKMKIFHNGCNQFWMGLIWTG